MTVRNRLHGVCKDGCVVFEESLLHPTNNCPKAPSRFTLQCYSQWKSTSKPFALIILSRYSSMFSGVSLTNERLVNLYEITSNNEDHFLCKGTRVLGIPIQHLHPGIVSAYDGTHKQLPHYMTVRTDRGLLDGHHGHRINVVLLRQQQQHCIQAARSPPPRQEC